jgi:Transcriptional regulatory protein, C terminal
MTATDSLAIRIGAWRVDPALDEISKDGNTVKLERRAMQLLVFLSKHADQVVSVEQLLDEVWAGVVVTPDSVYQAVSALRRMLGDDSHDPHAGRKSSTTSARSGPCNPGGYEDRFILAAHCHRGFCRVRPRGGLCRR